MAPTMPVQASESAHEKCQRRQRRLNACTFFAYPVVRPGKEDSGSHVTQPSPHHHRAARDGAGHRDADYHDKLRGFAQPKADRRRASSLRALRARFSLRALLLLSLEPLLALFDLRPPQRRQAVVPLAERALRQRTPRAKLDGPTQRRLMMRMKQCDDALAASSLG